MISAKSIHQSNDLSQFDKSAEAKDISCLINQTMKKHKIIPDVIDTEPSAIAEISYTTGAKVNQGNELTPTQVKDPPTVRWAADENTFYTLCMIDPDAPSRANPKFREWHHWLVGNIPGSNIEKGDTLSAYIGSGPPKGSGLHRYVFVIYKQPGKIDFKEQRLSNTSGQKRGEFSVKKFADKYNLGQPIAGNFYQAQWDNYVPTLYKQLGS